MDKRDTSQTGSEARPRRKTAAPTRQAPAARRGDLLRVHAPSLVDEVLAPVSEGLHRLDPDTVVCPASGQAALHAAGAGVAAVDAVMAGQDLTAFCAVHAVVAYYAELKHEQGRRLRVTALVRGAEPHLPYFAVPRYVRVVTAMPLTANGKISKQQVRDQGVPAITWDAEAVGFTATR